MRSVDALDIDLRELKDGVSTFEYALDDAFFEAIDAPDIKRGALNCAVTVKKVEDFFEVDYHVEGIVHVPCDRCLEDMEQPISADSRLVVKFGEEYSEDDDIITIAEDEGILNLGWFVYESVVLDVPIQHYHAPGECDPEMMKLLAAHSAGSLEAEKPIDERWSKLAELLDNN